MARSKENAAPAARTARARGVALSWTHQDLIACVAGPLDGSWFTAGDWAHRVRAGLRVAQRLAGKPRALPDEAPWPDWLDLPPDLIPPVLAYVPHLNDRGAAVIEPHPGIRAKGDWKVEPGAARGARWLHRPEWIPQQAAQRRRTA